MFFAKNILQNSEEVILLFRSVNLASKLDHAAFCAFIFFLNFLFFLQKFRHFYASLIASVLFSALLLYGIHLLRKQIGTNKQLHKDRQQHISQILYALSMMPHDQALDAAACALSNQYGLILAERATSEGCIKAYMQDGRCIAIDLHQSPAPLTVEGVHNYHRERDDFPGIVMHLKLPSADAIHYAESLNPPLKLIAVQELPLDDSLIRYQATPSTKKKRTAFMPLVSGRKQAVRCMCFSIWMIVAYLATGLLSVLFPALGLVFYALYCKGIERRKELF